VAACPRSMELGSATKELMEGFAGGAFCSTGGGGGGGGGGTGFFLQPAANSTSNTPKSRAVMFRLLILNYAS
jgi:hypothetical protein